MLAGWERERERERERLLFLLLHYTNYTVEKLAAAVRRESAFELLVKTKTKSNTLKAGVGKNTHSFSRNIIILFKKEEKRKN